MSLSDVGIYLGDDQFNSGIGTVNIHPTKGTAWVVYIQKSFDSNGSDCRTKLPVFIIKRSGYCLLSEYKL